MMKMTWLGTGSAFNTKQGNTSFIMQSEKSILLVDCGFPAFKKMKENNLLIELTDIIITHFHSDHVGDLAKIGQYMRFSLDKKPTLHLPNEYFAQNLWDHCLRGGMEHLNGKQFGPQKLDDYFDLSVDENVEIHGILPILLIKTRHVENMESFAVAFNHLIYFSGDTLDVPPPGYQYYFQDCAFSRVPAHICYDDLAQLPMKMKKKMYLVHFGEDYHSWPARKEGFAGFVMPGKTFEFA